MRAVTALAVVGLLSAGAALADYAIVLKDGTRLLAKAKPEVKGKFLVYQTPLGSPQRIAVADVDEAKTEEANKGDLAAVQELGTPAKPATPTAVPAPTGKTKSLTELSKERRVAAQKTAIAEATPAPTATPQPKK